MSTTTFVPTTSTTVSPLQIVKMEISFVCEMSALIIHVAMIAGFFYLLRDAEKAAKRQAAATGTRPRELNQKMIYLSASVLVLGLMYNIAVLCENSLVKDCTKAWVHYNELIWMMLHRASLLSVYLYRLDTCFRGSTFAYPKWFINSLAVCIGAWTISSIGLNLAFYKVGEVDVHFRTGANGKTMCSWDLAADGIFYGSRIPEFVLTIVLLLSFLYKLVELHKLFNTKYEEKEKKPMQVTISEAPAPGRTPSAMSSASNTFDDEVHDTVTNDSFYGSEEQSPTPTIVDSVVTLQSVTSLSLDETSGDQSVEVGVELTAAAVASHSTTATDSGTGKQKLDTGKLGVADATKVKEKKKKRRVRRSTANRTQAYQIVFRRVAISTTIAIMSTYVVILGYNFFPPLSGFMSFDVCLNGFCVMAMFKFCQFLVKPMFGTRCQRCCCIQMVDKKGECLCRVGKDTGNQ